MQCNATLDRRQTSHGEIVLRRRGDDYQIIANGVFLMQTSGGDSERRMVTAAAGMASQCTSVLIGGLGVGHSLVQAAQLAGVRRVVVVELHEAVVEWHRGPLRPWSSTAMDDSRVEVVTADLIDRVEQTDEQFDIICADIDNGPDWTVTDTNARLYGPAGLALLNRRLRPGGAVAIWAAQPSPAFADAMTAVWPTTRTVHVDVPRGAPDAIYLGRKPR